MRRPRLPVLACVGLLVLGPGMLGVLPSRAATTGPPPSISLDLATAPAGQPVQVEGSGFAAREGVDLAVGTTRVGSATTDADGRFSATPVVVPAGTRPGTIQVTATGQRGRWTAQRPLVVKADWAGEAFDDTGRSGNPYENVLTPSTIDGIRRQWTVDGAGVGPVVDGYLGTYDQRGWTLRRVATGAEFRTVDLQLDRVYGSLMISYGPDTVTAVDLFTGRQVWRTTFPDTSRDRVLLARAGRVLYRLAGGGNLSRIDAATGAVSWSRAVPTDARGLIADADGATFVSGADTYVVGGGPVTVWRFTLRGELAWKSTGLTTPVFRGALSTGAGRVFVPLDDTVVALDHDTGVVRWRTTVGPTIRVGYSNGLALAGTSFASGREGVVALDAGTGQRRWATEGIRSAGADGLLMYSPRYEAIDVFDVRTGTKVSTIPLEANALPETLVVANGQLFVYYPVVDDVGNYTGNKVAAFGLPSQPPSFEVLDDTASTLSYGSGWRIGTNAGDHRGTDHYTATAGSTVTFRFTGTGFRYWYSVAPHHGIAAIGIDGGAETRIDEWAAIRRDGYLSWSSPKLAARTHTVTIQATGQHTANATASVISVDRIELGRN